MEPETLRHYLLHVGAARHLSGQHGFGLVKGPVSGNVECLSHGDFYRFLYVTCKRVDLAEFVTDAAEFVTHTAEFVTDNRAMH